MPLPRLRRVLCALPVLLVVCAGTAPVAHADLTRHTMHSLFAGSSARLAAPLPTIHQAPRLTRSGGKLVVTARVGFRASNWHKRKGVLRDRVGVVLHVSRRMRTTGPDPAKPLLRRWREHLLDQRQSVHRYRWVLPRGTSRWLIRRGVFARDGHHRSDARRLVWIETTQDRDFQAVDGSYDWREARAANASERITRPGLKAQMAASNNPEGHLTVQNATGWGIYGSDSAPLPIDDTTNWPSADPQTVNNAGAPVVVAADAMQCFDSGTSGSDPYAFANIETQGGAPTPYQPGGTVQLDPDQGTTYNLDTGWFPETVGFAVSAPIAADDSIARASNNEQADATGYIADTLNLAFAAGSLFVKVPSGFGGGSNLGFLLTNALDVDTIPNPGAIVSSLVNIALNIIDASCDGNANLLGLAAAEPSGGTISADLQIQENLFTPFVTVDSSGTYYGLQANPSTQTYNGSNLYLNMFITGPGVEDAVSGPQDRNYIGIDWQTDVPCTNFGYPASLCAVTPAASPEVSSGTFDCGTNNADCPFAAAGFPAGVTAPAATAGAAPPTATNVPGTASSASQCATQVPSGSATYGAGSAVFSPDGRFELLMTSLGVLELIDTQTQDIVWGAPLPNATQVSIVSAGATPNVPMVGASWSLQPDGDLQLANTSSDVSWSSNTPGGGTGTFLAVQNDGNLVVYDATGMNALWSSGSTTTTPCPAAGVAPTPPAPTVTTSLTDSCATLLTTGTYPSGSRWTSPDGSHALTMLSNGNLVLNQISGSSVSTLWYSGQAAQPPGTGTGPPSPGDSMIVTDAGGLIVGQSATVATFDANVNGTGLTVALQNDGNLVVYDATATALWATGTATGTPCPAPTVVTTPASG